MEEVLCPDKSYLTSGLTYFACCQVLTDVNAKVSESLEGVSTALQDKILEGDQIVAMATATGCFTLLHDRLLSFSLPTVSQPLHLAHEHLLIIGYVSKMLTLIGEEDIALLLKKVSGGGNPSDDEARRKLKKSNYGRRIIEISSSKFREEKEVSVDVMF